jgi:glyoxylase I family protein
MTDEQALAATLYRLELALASADPAGIDGGLATLIADDFTEFGASGRTWSAPEIRVALDREAATDPPELLDFRVAELAPGVVLATYRLGPPRPSRRSSVWVRRDGRWQVRFHQGTLTGA